VTAETALGMLCEEGLIESRERSGYFVCAKAEPIIHCPFEIHLLDEAKPETYDDFPVSLWFKTMRRVMSEKQDLLLQKSEPQGSARLRNVLALYLWQNRQMQVQPEQIVIAPGAEALYETVLKMFQKDFAAVIESPCYSKIETVYRQYGCKIDAVPMRKDGLDSAALAASECEFLHVTPYCSFPSGISTSAAKRKEYLLWIQKRKGYIIEDDVSSEFLKSGPVLPSLYSLDRHEKVIYLSTFSMSMSPALRLGYMILPGHLLPLYQKTAGLFSNPVTMLEQYTLAEFIESGSYARLLRRRKNGQKNTKP
jgi:GntR family transcriptional regulator/MocR family aminotransferase